jgi:hypothetical protein
MAGLGKDGWGNEGRWFKKSRILTAIIHVKKNVHLAAAAELIGKTRFIPAPAGK